MREERGGDGGVKAVKERGSEGAGAAVGMWMVWHQ